MRERQLKSETETHRLGAWLGPRLQRGDCITLRGPLGAGKTALARALIQAISGQGDVTVISPTFMLMQQYDVALPKGETTLWHVDGYRLQEPEEWRELGLEELRQDSVLVIEWPEIYDSYLPSPKLDITVRYDPNGPGRMVNFTGHGAMQSLAEQCYEASYGSDA